MVLRSTRVAPTVLTQVGHEGNPTETNDLNVTGTLDGNPVLLVGPGTPDGINNNTAPTDTQIGGGAWTPAQLPSIYAWHDMSQETAWSDGNTITTLLDFSGNSHTMTGTGATYKTNILNGLPVVRFAGGALPFRYGASLVAVDPFWICFVMKITGGGRYWGHSSVGLDLILDGGNTFRQNGPTFNRTGSTVVNDSVWRRVVMKWGSSGNDGIWLNAVAETMGGVNHTTVNQTHQPYLGDNDYIFSSAMQGDIAEVVFVNGDMTSGNRGLLDNYWNLKYGI